MSAETWRLVRRANPPDAAGEVVELIWRTGLCDFADRRCDVSKKKRDNKKKRDRALGMDAEITRRDFLDGVAMVAVGGTMVPPLAGGTPVNAQTESPPPPMSAQQVPPSDYPPRITGLRGQTDAARNAGHAVRDGSAFSAPVDTGEFYDLVVVGAGMAGLGAAYFYRKQIPHSKVLLIDGCQDFGGHAVQNEFMVDGTRLIAGGGTFALWRPNTFPPEAQELIRDIGIDRAHYEREVAESPNTWGDSGGTPTGTLPEELGLRQAMFFDKESFGEDRLVMTHRQNWASRAAMARKRRRVVLSSPNSLPRRRIQRAPKRAC